MQPPQPKIPAYIFFYLLLFVFLPLVLLKIGLIKLGPIFLFYISCFAIVFFLLKDFFSKKYGLEYKVDELKEKINILLNQESQEKENTLALKTKIERYNSLKQIIEEISKDLDLESVADSLTGIASSVICNKKCVALLYLLDLKNGNLTLFKTRKADERLIIKAKEGDIFDQWVMKHLNPLVIEDIKKDFRFDTQRSKSNILRTVSSLVSAPFLSEQRFLGLLRLDSQHPNYFKQDDLRLLVTICDIGAVALENSELFKKTQDLAIHDSLTQLYTRGYFLERLKEECKRSLRMASEFSLLMVDIDHFKNYNDQYGHTAGDIVLQKISSCILNTLKNINSIASRLGGEEFCIILDNIDKKKAVNIANEIRENIQKEELVLRRHETHVTVSIGVANFPADAIEEHELMLKADKSMYEAKQKGRNKVVSA